MLSDNKLYHMMYILLLVVVYTTVVVCYNVCLVILTKDHFFWNSFPL